MFHCKDCERRHIGCHATCAEYQQACKDAREVKRKAREYYDTCRSSATIRISREKYGSILNKGGY